MSRTQWALTGLSWAWICLWCCCSVQAVTLTVQEKSVSVKEKETTSKELTQMSCTPSTSTALCSVQLIGTYPTNPCGSCFALYPCGTEFCLRFLPGQGYLSPFMVPRYTLTVRASEGSDSVTSIVDVHVKPNAPPYFNPRVYNNGLHVTMKLSNGVSVKAEAKDEDDDALRYRMTTVPSVDGIEIDSLSGTITATKDLRTLCRSFVTGLVYVKDDYHSEEAGPLAITLEIDANDRPIINNLNSEVHVRENEVVDVLPLAAYDADGDTLTFNILSAVPSSAKDFFDISNGRVRAKTALDYESYTGGVTLTIQADDGFCQTEVYQLQVKIVDINEPPVLLPVDQTLESCEGLVDIHPNWNFSDPDIGDVIRFMDIQPNDNGRFRINEQTGVVSTTINYDLDVDKLAATVVNVVTLSDRQGETATASLTIRFADCNDNPPVFVAPARHYMVRDCWTAGTVVGTVAKAEDLDSSYRQNNVFSHSGSGPGAVVQESGSIVITQQFTAGQTVTFPAYATDKGQVPRNLTSKPFWVSLYTLPCIVPPPPETTTGGDGGDDGLGNDVDFWSGANLGWLIPALLLALLLLALPFYFLWRYWGRIRNCCARRRPRAKEPPRPITPTRRPTPPPEKQGPAFIFGWWKETYRNDDYERQPNRKALPEPSKGPEPVNTNTYLEPEPPAMTSPTPPSSRCHIL